MKMIDVLVRKGVIAMTVLGFIILVLIAVVVGAIAEAVVGYRPGYGWVGTMVIGLVGAWIGSALVRIGPVIGGMYFTSAIIGAIVLTAILKGVTSRGTV